MDKTINGVILNIENISMEYKLKRKRIAVLSNIFISINKGEIYALIGPNGSGKTTLIRIIMNFINPSNGNVKIKGIPVSDHQSRNGTGYVPEINDLTLHINAYDFISTMGKLSGMTKPEIKEKYSEIIGSFKINFSGKNTNQLSKGMKRILAFSQALLPKPGLLILDEPTDGLDPGQRNIVLSMLKRFKEDGGTALICTHRLDEAEMLCDRFGVLKEGHLVYSAEMKEFNSAAFKIITEPINTVLTYAVTQYFKIYKQDNGSYVIIVDKQDDLLKIMNVLQTEKINFEVVPYNKRLAELYDSFFRGILE